MSFNNPRIKTAVNIWLAVLDFAGLLTVYEIAALQNHWWHSISQISYTYQLLGWFITAAMLTVVAWWIYHFHQKHTYWRIKRWLLR